MLRDFGEKGVIRYVCSNCGRTVLTEYISHIQCPDSVPDEQLNAYIKQKVSLFRENFNERHDYTGVENPVICPHCAKLQPWSYIPPKQHLTFISIALRIFMAACVLMVTLLPVILSSEDIDFGLHPIVIGIVSSLVGVPLYILIFLPVFQKNRARKKALKRLESEHFIFPEYYDETNMNELPDNKTVNTVNDEVQNIETVNTVSDEPQDIPERCILKIKEGSGIINYGTTFISMERHDTLRYTCSNCKHVQQFDYVLKKKARVKENELECYEILEHYYYPDAMNRAIACLNDKLTRKSEKLKYEVNTKHI